MATIGLLAPISELFIAVIILIIADWITGIWKSLKCKRRLTSFRLRMSISKLVTYLLAIYLAALFDNYLTPNIALNLAGYVAAYIGLTELVSIYENISIITGKELMSDIGAAIKKSVTAKLRRE